MKKYNFIAEISGLRLDVFVLDNFENIEDIEGVTRSQIKGLIGKGAVLVNNESKKAGYVMKVGDSVGVTIEDAREMDLSPANIPIDIVYEDDDIAVINKQQGLVVHPAQGSYDNTLVNALLFH
ncbi:MAG: RNA pseudouridine synthase, partial [Clostridia bacterium]